MEFGKVIGLLLAASFVCLAGAQSSSSTTARPQLPFSFPEGFPSSLYRDDADPSIILGERAQEGEFPFQAYLYSTRYWGLVGASCGGSLIQPSWVLTAAHCVDQMDNTEVRLGGTNFNNMTYRQRASFTRMHEQYNRNTLENDVALLRLPMPASGSNIAAIGLPAMDIGTLEGETAVASGFGRTSNNGQSSPNLMRVDLEVITNQQCMETYGNIIVNSTMCANWFMETGQSGQSTCQGDSGGPLSYNNGTVLIGVVSFVSSRGCDSGAPSGYARVSSFLDWIEMTMAQNPVPPS